MQPNLHLLELTYVTDFLIWNFASHRCWCAGTGGCCELVWPRLISSWQRGLAGQWAWNLTFLNAKVKYDPTLCLILHRLRLSSVCFCGYSCRFTQRHWYTVHLKDHQFLTLFSLTYRMSEDWENKYHTCDPCMNTKVHLDTQMHGNSQTTIICETWCTIFKFRESSSLKLFLWNGLNNCDIWLKQMRGHCLQ